MPSIVSRHTTARPQSCIPINTRARSNPADISHRTRRPLRRIPLVLKGDCGLPVSAGSGLRLGVYKGAKVSTCRFERRRCPMPMRSAIASSNRRAPDRTNPMCHRHDRSPAMTIAKFRSSRCLHGAAPALMFYLPRSFQCEESPTLIEARIQARRWMQQRGIGQPWRSFNILLPRN